MVDDFAAEREVERLQAMHETVERLRSQLRTIKMESPGVESDRAIPEPSRSELARNLDHEAHT